MATVSCEWVAVGDVVFIPRDPDAPERIEVTRVEIRNHQVFLYAGTGVVVSLFKAMELEREDRP